jgi:hypothetical protein
MPYAPTPARPEWVRMAWIPNVICYTDRVDYSITETRVVAHQDSGIKEVVRAFGRQGAGKIRPDSWASGLVHLLFPIVKNRTGQSFNHGHHKGLRTGGIWPAKCNTAIFTPTRRRSTACTLHNCVPAVSHSKGGDKTCILPQIYVC